MRLPGGTALTGNPARLNSARLNSARLNSARLNSARLNSARLNSARLNSARLNSARLNSARLNSARLNSARLNSARLNSARLNSARLNSARLNSARLNSARLNSARLNSARLNSARLNSARQQQVGARGGQQPVTPGVGMNPSGPNSPGSAAAGIDQASRQSAPRAAACSLMVSLACRIRCRARPIIPAGSGKIVAISGRVQVSTVAPVRIRPPSNRPNCSSKRSWLKPGSRMSFIPTVTLTRFRAEPRDQGQLPLEHGGHVRAVRGQVGQRAGHRRPGAEDLGQPPRPADPRPARLVVVPASRQAVAQRDIV